MVRLTKLTKKRLGEILIEEGLVKEEQINVALHQQKQTGEMLGEVLVKMGWVSEMDIARTISKQFGLPYLEPSRYSVSPDLVKIFQREELKKSQYVVLDKIGKSLIIAGAGLIDADILDELEKKTGSQIFIYVATASQISATLDKYWPEKKPTKVTA